MNTPLQNGMGHIYGPGKTLESSGIQPCWLDQSGSRIFGGIIDLQSEIKSGLKVVDVYPEAIRTGTPCVKNADGNYIPIPTYRVVEDLDSMGTTLKLANWPGMAKLKDGMSIGLPDGSKKITVASLTTDSDGNYNMTITGNDLGELKVGDVLIIQDATAFDIENLVPLGLTKDNLIYVGADPTSKLNITLCDTGRIMEYMGAPVTPGMKSALQTIKFEEI